MLITREVICIIKYMSFHLFHVIAFVHDFKVCFFFLQIVNLKHVYNSDVNVEELDCLMFRSIKW